MEASSLPISESHRGKLISVGYTSFSSLSSVSSSHLAQDLKISENEEAEILKVASRRSGLDKIESGSHTVMNGAQMAWDMLHKEESSLCITTSCSNLDEILGGGIHCNEVTEIGGVPGIGKTQLGIQMVINAQIPAAYGGLGGKAIYDADTEGSFMVERVLQIDKACAQDMLEYNNLLQKDPHACCVDKQSRDFLDNIFYFQIWTHTEQIAAINYLEKFISEHKDVVLLNQVTTKYTDGSFQLTLALGDSWSHDATNRIILYWNGNERYAYIDKSPTLPSASAPYAVTSRGDACIWDLSRSSDPSHFPPLKETASHVQKIIPIAQSSHNNQQPHDFDSITNFKGKLYREKISSVWIVRSFNSLKEGDQLTAFCIDKRGILLTCAHGILDECEISAIHLKSRKTYNVNVVGKSAAWDMALLIVETDEEEFDSLSFADEGYEVLCGQELHVIGHPEVLEGSFYSGRVGYSNDGFDRALLNEIEEPGISYTCTFERVEGHRRMGNIMPILNCATITRNPNIPFIQISIPAVSGSSGAPAFNDDGVVVGMCQSGFGYIQLAIHFCALRHFLQRLKPIVDELLNEELKRRAETTRVKKKKKRVLRLHLMGFSKACVRRWI